MSAEAMIGVAILLATLNNAFVEYVFGTPFDKVERLQPYKWLLMYIAIGTAMLIVYGLRANFLLYIIRLAWPEVPAGELAWWVTAVLSAVLIARGSNYIANLPWLKDRMAGELLPLEEYVPGEAGPAPAA